MAIQVQKINPLDLRESVGIGVSLPFTGKAVFNTTYTTREATKTNLINYFLTDKGERYFAPSFGSNIRKLLFDNINESKIEQVKYTITQEMQLYFPRVVITVFEVTGSPDLNTIRVYLKYSIDYTNIEDEILIDIQQ
jgi:phage baseplate assembly protein W